MTVTTAYIVVGDPDTSCPSECPDCGFDAVLAFPLTLVGENGVGPFGTHKECARCYEERQG